MTTSRLLLEVVWAAFKIQQLNDSVLFSAGNKGSRDSSNRKSQFDIQITLQIRTVNIRVASKKSLRYRPLPGSELFNDNYIISTHLVPAACPRLIPDIPLPVVPQFSTNASERRQEIQQLAAEIAERQERHAQGTLSGERSEKPLWNCVNRYAKRVQDGRKGLTLFLAHANGFPKEIWETTLRYLLSSPSAPLIDEVWSWEAVQHGDAALVNETNLSGICSVEPLMLDDWVDNARDIAHFLLHYLPEDASSTALPTHLYLLPETISEYRMTKGFLSRSLVAVGHSFGGCSSSCPKSQLSPRLQVDDVDPCPYKARALAVTASPFFGAWHPDTLQLYVTYGLCEDSQGGVKLKMSALHEALVFSDHLGSNETWEVLEKVDERIELRWVVPGKPGDKGIMGEQATRVRVWRRPANSSNVVIHSAGHLIPHESPEELVYWINERGGSLRRALVWYSPRTFGISLDHFLIPALSGTCSAAAHRMLFQALGRVDHDARAISRLSCVRLTSTAFSITPHFNFDTCKTPHLPQPDETVKQSYGDESNW
ncbi:hypothetical protein DFH29DRAFT_873941 [Suillus ampliporus]|nr:hypothetical protein DFH29DRAFT_873941 [Suillus ampliporus]